MTIVIYDYHIFIVQATAFQPHLGQGIDKLERLVRNKHFQTSLWFVRKAGILDTKNSG